MTKLERKTVTRRVVDELGAPLIVQLTPDGITFRRPRDKHAYLLPYGVGEMRAITLYHGIGQATGRRGVSRGLLSTGRS